MIDLSHVIKINHSLIYGLYEVICKELDMVIMNVYQGYIVIGTNSVQYKLTNSQLYEDKFMSKLKTRVLALNLSKLDIFELSSELLSLTVEINNYP
jgi:hypothetical protein